MRQAQFEQPAPTWLRVVFLLPCAGVGAGLVTQGEGMSVLWAGVVAALAGLVWGARVGKYPALMLVFAGWLVVITMLAMVVSYLVPEWLAVLGFGIAVFWVVYAVVRIATPWGYDRAARLAAAGRPVREWEWVQTGPEFARSHKMGQFGGALYLVAGFVVFQWAVWVWQVTRHADLWQVWLGFAALTLLSVLTLYALVARRRGARGLVWVHLALGFPLSLPLVVYWADGVRPNLAYAHRFERLVPDGGAGV